MSELSPTVRALLDRASARHEPEPQDVERTLSRLHGSLAFAAPALGTAVAIASESAASAPSQVGAAGMQSLQAGVASAPAGVAPAVVAPAAATYAGGALVGAQAVKLYLVVAAVIGGVGTFAVFRTPTEPQRPHDGAPRIAPMQGPTHVEPHIPSAPVIEQSPPVDVTPARDDRGARAARPRPSAAEELSVIEAAQRALQRAEPERALALIDGYARRGGPGQLRAERDGLRAIALCQLGRAHEGRVARDAFLARWPGAPIAARVEAACGGRTP